MEEITWVNENSCETCGKYLPVDFEDTVCYQCKDAKYHFDKGYTCMVYDTKAKKMMKNFKFGGQGYMAEKLADMMVDKLEMEAAKNCSKSSDIFNKSNNFDLITTVPSHKKKLKERGYNPAELIAKNLGKKLNVPFKNKLIKRVYYQKAMNKLTRNERNLNVIGSYASYKREDLTGKSILLVDDIYTTGSTVNTCAKILKEMGAEKVIVITVASGLSHTNMK